MHAFLSASQYHWVNYDDEKLDNKIHKSEAARRGTELHELAHNLVRLGVRLPRTKATLNQYVNDALGFRMSTEVVLYYSDVCFGTADAISFRKNLLRVHDLKTGENPTKMTQLEIYAALFCLEYRVKPFEIEYELRIYQNDEIDIHKPDPARIAHIIDKIISSSRRVEQLREEYAS